MTQTITAIMLATAMVFSGQAASNAEHEFDRAAIEQAAERLGLNETQREAVKPIIEAGIRERMQILQDAGFERGQRPSLRQLLKVRGPIRLLRARTDAELSEVLSFQQLATYRLLVEEQRQKLREKHFGDL